MAFSSSTSPFNSDPFAADPFFNDDPFAAFGPPKMPTKPVKPVSTDKPDPSKLDRKLDRLLVITCCH